MSGMECWCQKYTEKGGTPVSSLIDREVIFHPVPTAGILDLCISRDLPKAATPASMLIIWYGPKQIWNDHDTREFSWQQGARNNKLNQ